MLTILSYMVYASVSLAHLSPSLQHLVERVRSSLSSVLFARLGGKPGQRLAMMDVEKIARPAAQLF